jgi:peptide/nickel transport system substrate-binding protein
MWRATGATSVDERTGERDRSNDRSRRPRIAADVRRRRRWHRGAALAIAATALATVGCGSSETSGSSADAPTTTAAPAVQGVTLRNMGDEGEPVEGGKFVIGLEAETESGLNPITSQLAASGHMMASAVFDPLATMEEDGTVVPYLAESIEPNADFTEWTIKVRDGVQFHDGTPLTSEAVKATLDGHATSIVTKDAVRAITGTEIVDPLTVKVSMSQPWAQFPYTLTTQVGYIPAPSMLADPEGAFHPVGTGPFVFESWTIGKSFKATRNDSYWQDGKPHLSSIEFQPIPDAQVRTEAVLSGEIDLMPILLARSNEYLRDRDVKMLEVANGEESSITLNTAQAPFDNPIARQAVAAATDVERFLAETGRDLVDPVSGVFAPGQLGYREGAEHQSFDLEKAKELTAQYEAETGQPLSFVYDGADTVDDRAAQQLLKEMWDAAGMTVGLNSIPQSDQIINTVLGNYQATDWRNFGSPDPDGDYVWWHSTSVGGEGQISLNVPRFGDPKIDAALDEARATTDETRRDELYAQVSELLNASGGYVWLERPIWALVSGPKVNGFRIAQNGSISTIGSKTWIADLWVSP